jgi:hypothetical protein
MKRSILCSIVLGCIICVFVLSAAIGNDDEEGYPLSKGNFWVYKGKASWTTEGTKVVERIATIRMEVIDVIKRDHLLAAVMKGDFGDYAADKATDMTNHLILRVGATTYFDIDSERTSVILTKIKDPKVSLYGLLRDEEEQMLDLPLVLGKTYGNAVQLTRKDQYYCWLVTKAEDVDLSSIKALEPIGKKKQYTIRYFTLPGEVFMDFVPGIGITGYRYKHHGTVDEADLKLIEFGTVALNENKAANK